MPAPASCSFSVMLGILASICHSRKFSAGIHGLFPSIPWRRLRSRFRLLRVPPAPLTPALSHKGRGRKGGHTPTVIPTSSCHSLPSVILSEAKNLVSVVTGMTRGGGRGDRGSNTGLSSPHPRPLPEGERAPGGQWRGGACLSPTLFRKEGCSAASHAASSESGPASCHHPRHSDLLSHAEAPRCHSERSEESDSLRKRAGPSV